MKQTTFASLAAGMSDLQERCLVDVLRKKVLLECAVLGICLGANSTDGEAQQGETVERENMSVVQFHPEKNHKFGMRLLENLAKRLVGA